MKRHSLSKKGISPVLSSILLTAAALSIGISLWGFALSAGSVLQQDYLQEVNRNIEKVKERFLIEHICFDDSTDQLHVWIYNYGKVPISINVYVLKNSTIVGSDLNWTSIGEKEIVEKVIPLESVESSDFIVVEVLSGRGNVAYSEYIIP